MTIDKLVIAVAMLFLVGCSDDDAINYGCVASVLDENNMVAYNGQDIGCKFFFQLYNYQDKQYFLLGSHCADIISYPTDCEGNELCQNAEGSECEDFYENAEYLGIIGIDE